MKYDVQKRSEDNSDIWHTVASTDSKKWAEIIAVTLSACEDGEFCYYWEYGTGSCRCNVTKLKDFFRHYYGNQEKGEI